jgi:hypothetical protein
MDEKAKATIKAEAIALRALGYCNLISLYRDVPYITTPLTLENPEAPKELKKTIAEKVIAEFKVLQSQIACIFQPERRELFIHCVTQCRHLAIRIISRPTIQPSVCEITTNICGCFPIVSINACYSLPECRKIESFPAGS